MAQIVADLRGHAGVGIVMVSGLTETEETQLFVSELGIGPSEHHRTDMRGLRLQYVPAVVVSDRSGVVLLAKEGLFTQSDRHEVVKAALN